MGEELLATGLSTEKKNVMYFYLCTLHKSEEKVTFAFLAWNVRDLLFPIHARRGNMKEEKLKTTHTIQSR